MTLCNRMWQRIAALPLAAAFGLLLSAAAAHGQSAPPTMNDHTVWGRLGSGTGSGPGQAIPFTVLSSQLFSSPTIIPKDVFFISGRPWFDVRAFGAKGDNSTDDTVAVQAAENAAAAAGFAGATVYWPDGIYCLNGGITVSGNDIRNVGTSVAASYARICNDADVTVFHLEGTRDTIEHMSIDGPNLTTTNHAAVWADTGAVNAKLDDVLIHYGVYGFLDQAADVVVTRSTISYSYNSNVAATAGDGLYFLRSTVDQGTPNNTTCTAIAAWSGTASVLAGACKTVGSFVIQYTQAGTTGGSSPTVLPYGSNIADGTATAQLMAPTTFTGMLLQTNVNFIEDSDFSGPFLTAGIEINNSAAGNVISHSILTAVGSASASAVLLSSGNQAVLDGNSFSCSISGCLGLNVGTGWTGDGIFTNNTAYGIAQQAFIIQGGAHYALSGNVTGGDGTGLYIAAGVLSVNSTGNNWGGDTPNGGNTTGIVLATGNSDYIQITNDDLKAAGTALTNGSTGTHNSICNNAGSTACSWPSGLILPVTAGGTGVATITGAVKGNGTSAFTQAACADLSNGGTACAANTGTSGATVPLLNGNNQFSGQIIPAYGTPTIASGACGATTNGTIAAGGTNQSGEVIIASATTTTCTISFSTTLSAAPIACLLEPGNAQAATELANSYVSAITTGHFVITGTALASTDYYFHCF
jgi:hypothetical protein